MKQTPKYDIGEDIFFLDLESHKPISEGFIISIEIDCVEINYVIKHGGFSNKKISEYYICQNKEDAIEKLNKIVEYAKTLI